MGIKVNNVVFLEINPLIWVDWDFKKLLFRLFWTALLILFLSSNVTWRSIQDFVTKKYFIKLIDN